ncbi:MAG: molybdopterin cofactor-binding domain-containing protein, partial [Betaproteobacteria bacterium]
MVTMTRRQFMVGAAGLTFTVLASPVLSFGGIDSRKINAWVAIAPDGTVYIVSPAVEMGQGSMTSIPRIIADEMDADWDRVVIVPAAPDDKLYANPGRGIMYTAGSNAVSGYWAAVPTFGAQVRRVMMTN